jgi:TonB family protein
MFEGSRGFGRFKQTSRVLSVHMGHVPYLEEERPEEKRWRNRAIIGAVIFHVLLFVVHIPASELEPRHIGSEKAVYVVKQVRFQPPPPAQAQELPKPKERKRKIPIPDPTPEEPEPIRVAEIEAPEYDPNAVDDIFFGIPEAPPGAGIAGGPPMRLGGDIVPPVKIHYPQPKYTEEGRLSRIQGVVILEAIVDAEGDVHDVKILKGLPMGLAESAVDTAREWKFKPATLNGKPVPVYLNLTIHFSLQ